MDFPKSVPSVGLVDGKFIDEDAVAGTPGSLIPSAWGNAVTQEILKVIQEAGLEPDEDDNTQLNAAIDQKISGSSVAFASQAEAEAGESATKAMSPLRVFQAIAKVVKQATEGAFGWVKIATQSQVGAGSDDSAAVTSKKLAAATQLQAHGAFTTAGTAAALTLTPAPAIGDYALGQRFNVTFHVAGAANPTINVSAKGAKSLKQYNSSAAKVAAIVGLGQVSDIVYDGTDFVLLNQAPVSVTQTKQGRRGSALGWKASATGASALITCAADQLVVADAGGNSLLVSAIAISLNTAVAASAAVSGMASGATVGSAAYNIFVWLNPTSGAVVLTGDVSATAPASPAAGFTHWARRGTFRTDGTANKYPLAFIAAGDSTQLDPGPGKNITELVQLATAGGTISSTPVNLTNIVPDTASEVDFVLNGSASGANLAAAVTPRANSGNLQAGLVLAPGASGSSKSSLMLAEAGIHWFTAFSGGGSVRLLLAGWKDAL